MCMYMYIYIWANYNIWLTSNQAIWALFHIIPWILTMIPGFSHSEVTMIYPNGLGPLITKAILLKLPFV